MSQAAPLSKQQSVVGSRTSGTYQATDHEPARAGTDGARLRGIFDAEFHFVWRYLRRLGLSEADADDAAQQVFVVLARRLACIELGKERAFLCGTAVRVVSEHRRALARRREVASELDEAADSARHPQLGAQALGMASTGPEAVADRERARAILDGVLDQMDFKLRTVFVLFELEELGTAQIAETLDLPTGTVASRLRRARESFQAIVKRMRARQAQPGAPGPRANRTQVGAPGPRANRNSGTP